MVSYAKSTGKKPNWIKQKVWDVMVDYWKTEEAIAKSQRASKARNSPRGDLGPHRQTGGPKSHANIRRKMSKEQGRTVSLGEVFVKTHTKKDGTFVDNKAKKISETYEQNLRSALTQASVDPSVASDGASRTPQLTKAQEDDIFLKSTMVDARGNPYGIGRLAQVHKKKKKKAVGVAPSESIQLLQQQLQQANSKIEDQAAQHKSQMDRFFNYLKTKDPEIPTWLIEDAMPPPPPPNDQVPPSDNNDEAGKSGDDDEESGTDSGGSSGEEEPNNAGEEETT